MLLHMVTNGGTRECTGSYFASRDPGFETCIQFCQENNAIFRDFIPACVDENRALNQCQAALAPVPASP